LAAEGLCVVRTADWTSAELRWLEGWFNRHVLPVLTPLGWTRGGACRSRQPPYARAFLLSPGTRRGRRGPGRLTGRPGESGRVWSS
jgi:hypothetical protein